MSGWTKAWPGIYTDSAQVICGDALEVLRDRKDKSIHAIVTDPPYGLEFMGKEWDSFKPARGKWSHDHEPTIETKDDTPHHRAGVRQPSVLLRCARCGGNSSGQWNRCECAEPEFRRASWPMHNYQDWCRSWAEECLRVLKPGGHLVAFGGTRTSHRLTCAIEDAGFEIRDCLSWLYGCLSDDSEALTRRGWVLGTDLRAEDEVLQWESSTGNLSWVLPTRRIIAPYAGPMIRLVNRHTDQLLTPNHRVYSRIRTHSRNSASDDWTVHAADELRRHWIIDLPLAGMLEDGIAIDPEYAYIVGWWLTDAWRHGDGRAAMFSQSKPATLALLRDALAPYRPSEYIKKRLPPQHNDEHTFYVTGPLADRLIAEWPTRTLDWSVLAWDRAARTALLKGLLDGDGSRNEHTATLWSKNEDRRDIVAALFLSLGWRAMEGAKHGITANTRPSTQLQSRHRVASVDYEGLVWCVAVPSGAFVARRSGKPFITGNSGFPKSLDVSKAIDKAGGVSASKFKEWLAVEVKKSGMTRAQIDEACGFTMRFDTAYADDPVGWGVSLPTPEKWAVIVRVLSLQNVGQWDGLMRAVHRGRAGNVTSGNGSMSGSNYSRTEKGDAVFPDAVRWQGWGTALKPAWEPIILARKPLAGTVASNVLAHGTGGLNIDSTRIETTDNLNGGAYAEVGGHTESPSLRAGGGMSVPGKTTSKDFVQPTGRWPANVVLSHAEGCSGECAPGCPIAELDEQSNGASRFMYVTKASKKERPVVDGVSHATVKPLELMRWLVRMVTPPKGVVLDLFAGSGTTLEACLLEDLSVIAIEREPTYIPLIEARLTRSVR